MYQILLQKFLQEIRIPKLVCKSAGQMIKISNPSVYLPPLVHTASSKACLTGMPRVSCRQSNSITESTVEWQRGKEGVDEADVSKEPEQIPGKVEKAAKGVGANLYVALAAAHFKLHGKEKAPVRYIYTPKW